MLGILLIIGLIIFFCLILCVTEKAPKKPAGPVKVKTALYDGYMLNDQYHGYGVLRYPSKVIKYAGNWRKGLKDGFGSSYDTKGNRIYEGQYSNNKRHGYGKLYSSNGIVRYEGEFRNNQFNGNGKLVYENGNIECIGTWLNDRLNGTAKMFHKNGNIKYNGTFVDGQRDGNGSEHNKDGQIVYSGTWVKDIRTGEGSLYSSRGFEIYHGNFENNEPAPNDDTNTKYDEMTCVICMSNKRNIIITVCNHFVMCNTCSKSMNSCPICREHIDENDLQFVYMA